jgi:hypothetical protein
MKWACRKNKFLPTEKIHHRGHRAHRVKTIERLSVLIFKFLNSPIPSLQKGGRGDFDVRNIDFCYVFSAIFAASAVNGFWLRLCRAVNTVAEF